MKKFSLLILTVATILLCQNTNYGQAPNLGSTANFVLFTSVGAVTNTGISHLTGDVGTNSGSISGFGNVNGNMHSSDGASAQSAQDLLSLYNQLKATIPTFFMSGSLGNGQILTEGVYSIAGNATLNQSLVLDAQENENAVFIIQIEGTLSANNASEIILNNGALACNVFWKVEGVISMASASQMKGTFVANNSAINMGTGVSLEGRALSTAGAIGISSTTGYTPSGCGSLVLNGPLAPDLGSAICYAIFSSDGEVTNNGSTIVKGDVGTNVGLTTGFDPLNVEGVIHPIPDGSTAACASDLLNAYTYLNTLTHDIELLFPAQFGNDLVLTPHTYLLNAATSFTGKLYLDAQGNENAVFVIQINGALSTATFSEVVLVNGTQAKNVYWKIEGAATINDYSQFIGTMVVNNGAITLNTGMKTNGRAFTTTGALKTNAVNVTMTPGCISTSTGNTLESEMDFTIYPNPFSGNCTIQIDNVDQLVNGKLKIYNSLGRELLSIPIVNELTSFNSSELSTGMYFYRVLSNDLNIHSGKLISNN